MPVIVEMEEVVEFIPTHEPVVDMVETASVEHAAIAALAYAYWETRGCPLGSPEEDWFRAERSLRNTESK